MKRIIKWQSQHLEIDFNGKLREYNEDVDDDDDLYDLYEDEEHGHTQVQNVMSTPFGFWRVDDSMNPYRQFKMWMGHTNFSITSEIVQSIKEVPGVEVLQIMTRYRFLIGVGELFDIHDVRTTIEELLKCHKDEDDMITDERLLQQIHELRKQLSVYNQWAIYVFPNGQIDFATSEESNFGQQLNMYKQAVDYSNGVLIEGANEQHFSN